jgi:hypothetical protein
MAGTLFHGSGELVQTLLQNDLVDECRLWICPPVWAVTRTSSAGTAPRQRETFDVQTTRSGAVLHVYGRQGSRPQARSTPRSGGSRQWFGTSGYAVTRRLGSSLRVGGR